MHQSDLMKTIIKLDEEAEDEENKDDEEELDISKDHTSKNNNGQNQTNYLEDKEFDNFQLLEEFNLGFDDDVTLFTKMHYMKLNSIEKKKIEDLNRKDFSRLITFTVYENDEENFLTENTNEFTSRTSKIVERMNNFQTNGLL